MSSLPGTSSHDYVYDRLYMSGQWVKPHRSGMIDVINSTTEEVMGRVPEGNATDIAAAVAAAKVAFNAWPPGRVGPWQGPRLPMRLRG
jgi:hypothetical protein